MNDALSAGQIEEATLAECEARLAQVVRDGGDRLAVVREISARLMALPPPRFADRYIQLWRDMGRALNPGGISELLTLAEHLRPFVGALRDPSWEEVYWNGYGVILTQLRRFQGAIAAFEKASTLAALRANKLYESIVWANIALLFSVSGLNLDALAANRRARDIALAAPEKNFGGNLLVGIASNISYLCFLLGRHQEVLDEALAALARIPNFSNPQETVDIAFQAMGLQMDVAVVLALRGQYPESEAHEIRAHEWSRHATPTGQLLGRYVSHALTAIRGREEKALATMRGMQDEFVGEAFTQFGHSVLHWEYVAASSIGATTAAADALERLSNLYRARCADAIDALAHASAMVGEAKVPPQTQVTEYVASLASALRMPSLPLYDAWSHLVRLTEQASWVEDTSGGHPQRTARLAELLAETIGLDAHERGVVQRAGLIHDVGLSAFPIGLLQCGERSAREAQLYDSHAAISADFIARSNIPCSSQIADAVRHHLQPYDGQGGALVGEQLPLYARIIAIANAFDEMTHDRPGRPATPVRGALKDILRQRGREFDPQLVDRFIELVRQVEREHGNVLAYLSSAAGKT